MNRENGLVNGWSNQQTAKGGDNIQTFAFLYEILKTQLTMTLCAPSVSLEYPDYVIIRSKRWYVSFVINNAHRHTYSLCFCIEIQIWHQGVVVMARTPPA